MDTKILENKKKVEKANCIAEKIVELFIDKGITIDVAESALRRANEIIRSRSIVNLSHH